jgi:hypothetical protein
MKDFTRWLKECLSSSSVASFGRTATMVILFFAILWECYLLSKGGIWIDIPGNWLYLIIFLFGISKGGETVQAFAPIKPIGSTFSKQTETIETTKGPSNGT